MKKLIILFISVTLGLTLCAQTGIPKAQALFIYNFSRLIEWPADYKTGPFIIGVYGNSSALNELNSYANGKMVGTQKISVKKYDSPAEISKCHILFVAFSKSKEIESIASSLGSKSTLIVSEKNGACNNGAAINFLVVGDKLKFEIKPSNATAKNIKLSSKLSEMAFKTY